jgi:hypothetical protein
MMTNAYSAHSVQYSMNNLGDDKLNTSSMQNELIGIIVVLNEDNKSS